MANSRPPQEVLDRIAAADVSETGISIVDGKYTHLVKKIFFGDKRKGLIFICDFDVVTAEQTNKDVTPNAVGSSCGYAVAFYGNGADMADGNVKGFIISAFLGEEVAKKGTPLFKAQQDRVGHVLASIIGDDQPARGMLVGCVAHTKPQAKDKTKDFTHHNWSKVESSEQEIKDRRAKLEAEMAAPPSAGAPSAPGAGTAPAANGFVPTPPWRVHPSEPVGNTPETRWFWDGAAGVKNEAALRAMQVVAAPVAPAAPPPAAPVAPQAPAGFTPTLPWRVHPSEPVGPTPETRWFWDGAAGVKNEAQLKAGQ